MFPSGSQTKTEPLLRVIAVSAFFVVAWATIQHFDTPTTNISPKYESGFGAVLEQIGIAVTLPAYFAPDWTSAINRLPLIAIEFWPLLLLCFRPWRRLSTIARYSIVIYSSLLCLAIVALAVFLHLHWHQEFFSP